MKVRLLLALLGVLAFSTAAYSASTIPTLTTIGSGGSTFPLPDPGLTAQWLWITQAGSDYKISPTQLGYTYSGAAAPLNPFTYQTWIDTSTAPAILKRYVGGVWAAERNLSTASGTSLNVNTALTSAHLLVGNASNVSADVAASGDLTLANTGAFTIANNAVTTAKIADAQITPAKIAGGAPFTFPDSVYIPGSTAFDILGDGDYRINTRNVLTGTGTTLALGTDTNWAAVTVGNTAGTLNLLAVAAVIIPSGKNLLLTGGGAIQSTPAAPPANPGSGWYIYTDSGDLNKLKARASTGTVVTLATP